VTDTYDYFAFGEVLSRTGTTQNEFTYTGEQFDPNAGFYYLRARWYDPSRGRFASVDLFEGDPQASVNLHRYLYANASPVSMIDPSGNNTLLQLMTSIAVSTILATNAQTTTINPITKTYSLILYMLDYYDVGPDGKKNTGDDLGITSFPAPCYSGIISLLESAFEAENAKGKAKFKMVWTAGMKSEVFRSVKMSRYSAVLSHSSNSFHALFPSL
jgi:RHS repeat-associated protein